MAATESSQVVAGSGKGSPLSPARPALEETKHRQLQRSAEADVVVIGNGPSALVVSFLLHGFKPYYAPTYPFYNDPSKVTSPVIPPPRPPPHPDILIHRILAANPSLSLLDQDLCDLALQVSFAKESRASSPLTAVLDTLERPDADVNPGGQPSRIIWARDVSPTATVIPGPKPVLSHVVLGKGPIGGTWAGMAAHEIEDESQLLPGVRHNFDIDMLDSQMEGVRTLSYATDLELPGFPFAEWLCGRRRSRRRTSSSLQDEDLSGLRAWSAITRPLRRDVARYYRDYAVVTGIAGAVHEDTEVHVLQLMEEALRMGECACSNTKLPPRSCLRCQGYRYLVRGTTSVATTGFLSARTEFAIRTNALVLATGSFDESKYIGVPGECTNGRVVHSIRDAIDLVMRDRRTGGGGDLPVMVIGSGLSAADGLLSIRDLGVPLLHVFRSEKYYMAKRKTSAGDSSVGHKVSPLSRCPKGMYPDYARIWNLMQTADTRIFHGDTDSLELAIASNESQNGMQYIGFPDVNIVAFESHVTPESFDQGSVDVLLSRCADGRQFRLRVRTAVVLIGRKSNLNFLRGSLRRRFLNARGLGPRGHDDLEVAIGKYARSDPYTFRMALDSSTAGAPTDQSSEKKPQELVYAVGALPGEAFVRFGALGGPVAAMSDLLRVFSRRCPVGDGRQPVVERFVLSSSAPNPAEHLLVDAQKFRRRPSLPGWTGGCFVSENCCLSTPPLSTPLLIQRTSSPPFLLPSDIARKTNYLFSR